MIHGLRSTYQALHCRCLPCRAANATYQKSLRALKTRGQQPLGARVSAVEAQRIIRSLLAERFSKAEIARRAGFRDRKLRLQGEAVAVRSALKLRRLHRTVLAEPDEPPAPV